MDAAYDEEESGLEDERGNPEVIDVEEEENEEPIFPFDEDFFRIKLREKPQFPIESKGCGTEWPQKSYHDFKLSVSERISLPTLTSLDLLKKEIPIPEGCVPPLALPTWHYMPLEKKIPLVQSVNNLFYYTRGYLGKKLHRKPLVFSTKDPYNRERVVGGPYAALHDPNVRSFMYNPLVRDMLYERGFINESAEVLCTLQEFNKFRDYLRTQYCDLVWQEIELRDALIKTQRQQIRDLIRAENKADGIGRKAMAARRIEAAKIFHENALELKRQRHLQKDQMTETRLRQWHIQKERKMMEHVMQGLEEARRNRERREALLELRLQQRRDIMTKSMRKFLETEERQQNDKAMMQAAYNKFLLEWIESKYVFCYEKLVQRKQIQEDLRGNLKYKARKRQLRLERYREQLPAILERRKADAERLAAIVRKFAMRWLNKVRARLNAPKDLKHESCWIGQSKSVLDETVRYLRQESGYEKLDDFILNIMKLKKQIQHQIELEEAEEAAQAMLEEEGAEE